MHNVRFDNKKDGFLYNETVYLLKDILKSRDQDPLMGLDSVGPTNPCTTTFGFVAKGISSPAILKNSLKVTYDRLGARVHELRQPSAMQTSHLEVRQEGSHVGNTNALHSQIFQGNFYGLTINPTAAARVASGSFKGHYANSSLRPVPNYVSRPRLHQKIKEQLHDLKDDRVEDVRILAMWGLDGAGKSQLVLNYIHEYRQDYTARF